MPDLSRWLIPLWLIGPCKVVVVASAFLPSRPYALVVDQVFLPVATDVQTPRRWTGLARRNRAVYATSNDVTSLDSEDDAEAEPGTMRVSEIKAELDLRGVTYLDCFDKESLIQRLVDARSSGQADPSILQQFNKQRLEEQFSTNPSLRLDDESVLQAAVANDGSLPGGLSPELFAKMTSNPELMLLLQNSKMQEAMQLIMTGGGPDALEQQLRDDPELRVTVEQLNAILQSMQ